MVCPPVDSCHLESPQKTPTTYFCDVFTNTHISKGPLEKLSVPSTRTYRIVKPTNPQQYTAVRGPGGVWLRPGLHGGARLPGRSLRPDVRARGQLRGSGLLCLCGRLVWPQLHCPCVFTDLRQRWQLHRAGELLVRVGLVGRRRSRGAGGGRGRRRRGG